MIIYQIPKTSDLHYDHIIGVIDCSGSMSPHWKILANHWNTYIPKDKAITITFDTFAEVVESNCLDNNINYHGGGGTSIGAAFQLLEEKVSFIPKEKNVLVIFISDGQDNSTIVLEKKLSKLQGKPLDQRIDFICLGIGKDFPTFVAMKLRKLYHGGEDSVPAIFLIEYVSEQAFTNKFESLKPYFECNKPRKVNPKVCLFPWRENTENVFENSWVISDSKKILLDGKVEIEPPKNYFEGISELFRSWAQTIHLNILNEGESVIKRARKTLQTMIEILEEINSKEHVRIFDFDGDSLEINTTEDQEKDGNKFKNQAFRNMMKRQYDRMKWYFDDVKNIADGKLKAQTDQFEAAKLIGLGTIVGGYNQKILRLKHITVEDYLKFREEFKKIYLNTKLTEFSGQERSIVSLQNQKDLFLEKEFLEGLDLCKNQIDLFESFPLVGHALRVNRTESSLINPYFIEVQAIAKCNSTVDTIYININKGQVRLATGMDQFETINTVLPLLGLEDEDMNGLINSKLFNLAMTFNVIKNPDSLFEESYLALLANTIIHLMINENQSEWRNIMLTKIHTTSEIILKSKPEFKQEMQKFIANTNNFILSDKDQKINSNVDFSKSILMFFLIAESKKYDQNELERLLYEILVIVCNQRYIVEKNDIIELLAVSSKDKEQEKLTHQKIVENVQNRYNEFFTKGDLIRFLEKQIKSNFSQQVIHFDMDKIKKNIIGKVSFDLIDKLCVRYLSRPISQILVENSLMKMNLDESANLLIFKDLKENNEILRNSFMSKISAKFAIIKTSKDNIKTSKMYKLLLPVVLDGYLKFFEKVHAEIVPIPMDEIHKFTTENKIKEKILINDSLLSSNACLAKDCKFFLKPVKRISHHFQPCFGKSPRGFHANVKANYFRSKEDIYEILAKVYLSTEKNEWSESYGKSKEMTMQYIVKLKKAYEKILG